VVAPHALFDPTPDFDFISILEIYPMNQPVSQADATRIYDDEIDLFELGHSLWRQRGLIAGTTVATTLMVAVVHLGLFSLPGSHSIDQDVLFTFNGAEQGRYPDGSPFLQADILSNEVITNAIERVGLPQSSDQIAEAILIVPGNDMTAAIQSSLSALRENTKTPAETLQALDEAFIDLRAASQKSATIKLDMTAAEVSAIEGERLVDAILQSWAERSERDYGVTRAQVSLPLQPFEWDRNVDIALNIDALSRRLGLLETSIRQMKSIPGIETSTDGRSSIVDLVAEAELLRNSKIDPFRSFIYQYYAVMADNSIPTRIQRNGRIRTLELEIQDNQRLLQSYNETLDRIGRTPTIPTERVQGSLNSGPGVDGTFLNEMLKLGEELGDQELKRELQRKRLELVERISGLEQELALIEGVEALEFSAEEIDEFIELQFPQVVLGVNDLRERAFELLNTVSERNLMNRKNLYQKLGPARPSQAGYLPSKLNLQIALAVVLGGMIGCLIALIRAASRKRDTQILQTR